MFEYLVTPAPKKGKKAKGVRGGEDRFALAMTDMLNEAAAEGWDYVRAETLPSEERSGLTGKTKVFQNVLVFRRAIVAEIAEPVEAPIAAPVEPAIAPELPSATDANALPNAATEFTSLHADERA